MTTSRRCEGLYRLQYLMLSSYAPSLTCRDEYRALESLFSIISCGGVLKEVAGLRIYVFNCPFNERI